MQNLPLLSLLIALPFITAVLIGLAPAKSARTIALLGSLATFLVSLPLLGVASIAPTRGGFAFEQNVPWLPNVHVSYHVGVDGAAALLVVLSTFLQVFAAAYSQETIKERVKEFYLFLMVLEGALIGAFSSLDLILFYVFFELSLVPVYFLIGIWGGKHRVAAGNKFFVYTVVGSLLMLVSIIALYLRAGTFDLLAIKQTLVSLPPTPTAMLMLFTGFALAFAVKTPLFPFHTWLPDAYAESPIACTVLLSGAMAKLGTYGFYRFCLFLFPEASQQAAPVMVTLAVVGIIYGALVAAVQRDVKRVLAYSSVSHLGFVVLGLFSFAANGQVVPQALTGALLQNINHGISTGALFLIVGIIETRRGTRRINELGGLWEQMPVFGRLFLLVTLSSIALPLTNGFVGEFLILLGAFQAYPLAAALATTGVIWSAVYMLWMFQRVMYGPVTNPATRRLRDLNGGEVALLVPFVVLIFVFGLFPTLFTRGLNLSPTEIASPASMTAAREAAPAPALAQGQP
ncbi:MAG: NADH-quinone oxidoreductase subunit M [Cytophagales bacterium]|nr:NADH-quinone oxidoreductase subunit M [Armatimonadota bacterium]